MLDTALQAILEPNRREILRLVQANEMNAGEIAAKFAVTRPAISQHLGVLMDAGLLTMRRQGTQRLYRARPEGLKELREFLDEFWEESLERLADLAEAEERRNMTTRQADVIEKTIRIAAKPETIFSFFTDPQKMIKWKGIDARLDPRPGGTYRVNINGQDVAIGKYVEIIPYKKVVFTWGWEATGHPMPPGSSTVEITLTPDGDTTVLRLLHSGIPTQELRNVHAIGWDHFMGRLVMVATGKDPGPDTAMSQETKHS